MLWYFDSRTQLNKTHILQNKKKIQENVEEANVWVSDALYLTQNWKEIKWEEKNANKMIIIILIYSKRTE